MGQDILLTVNWQGTTGLVCGVQQNNPSVANKQQRQSEACDNPSSDNDDDDGNNKSYNNNDDDADVDDYR